jgi:hypothetical protein
MTRRRQKLHGTKLAQNGTKSWAESDVFSMRRQLKADGEMDPRWAGVLGVNTRNRTHGENAKVRGPSAHLEFR